MATRISIDVDQTIVDADEHLIPGAFEGLMALKTSGYLLTLWSYSGAERARQIAIKHNLDGLFEGYATKPDLVVDDDFESLSHLPTIDPLVARDWAQISERTIRLAENLDNPSRLQDAPRWLKAMWRNRFDVGVQSAMAIWRKRETYFRWPKEQRIISRSWVRHPDGRRTNCYDYPAELAQEIVRAGLCINGRNDGPAITSFLLAGGERPRRPYPSTWGWSIHHVYDGRHPRFPDQQVPLAISDPQLFTNSAGLVAAHPLADYVAAREPLLAWLLRWEAFLRFGFDPMGAFQ